MNPLRRGSSSALALAAVAVVVLGRLDSRRLPLERHLGGGAVRRRALRPPSTAPNVFRAKGCIACHDGPDGANSDFDVGPNLRELPAVASRRVAGLDAASYVRQSIQEPQAYVVKGHDPNEVGSV